jgi:hypothetical protein
MPALAEVVREHGDAYLERHGAAVLPSHVRALRAIAACRTSALGGHLAQCQNCAREHLLYHSCRHRACPKCGQDRAEKWLLKQQELLLPVPYFHVVFTLPSELRRLVRTHQKTLLDVLFRAAFDSLASLCKDSHYLGGQIGALAVLHTWTRTLEWHPHVHVLVPGGALAADGQTWLRAPRRKKAFLVPVKALAARFRGRFLHLARRALPGVEFPAIPWEKRWIVYCKPTVQGADTVLQYLGRYVQRTAITDTSIIKCENDTVSFRYKCSADGQRKMMTLSSHEFLRRFLQHVPPCGFHRVRAFGLLHPRHRIDLKRLQLLLDANILLSKSEEDASRTKTRSCPHCRAGELRILRTLSASECLVYDSRLEMPLIPSVARAPPRNNCPERAVA